MTYTIYRWVAVPLLSVYLLLLPRLTKPRPKPSQSRNSAGWLTIEIIVAGLCTAGFGLLTIFALWANLTRRQTSDWHIILIENTPVAVIFSVVFVIFDVTVPFLFAMSVRWTRSCALKWTTASRVDPE